jgi:ferric-dicitrate binding protein FerR (iron transport regulator)
MKLADDYAEACFDQGLHQRTADDKPEAAREKLEKELRRLHTRAQGLDAETRRHAAIGKAIERACVDLPDGTEISMGSQTNFRYDPQYGKEKRVVYLEGEAFFNVAKQKDKPFIVVVNGQEIEALGTKFNVDAYPSDSVVTTTLLEGSIRLVSEKVNTSTVLTPNQQYIYHKNKGSYKVTQVDAALYTSWISGYYYFHEENLEGILARLGNIYGVSFRIQSDKLKERRFTGTFYRGQSIKDILDIINISIPIR